MKSQKVLDLPIGGAGCGEIGISSDGTSVAVRYEYLDGGHSVVKTLRFDDVVAFRFHDEMHSRGFCPESYDAVVEIGRSEWLAELIGKEPEQILGSAKGKRHFAVLFSSNGYLEVIGAEVQPIGHTEN